MGRNQQVKSQKNSRIAIKDGFIRIISGKWRGKKLPVKNKETLFNWLMHDIREATCLDCFSGSGSLAFEALSRFAQHTTLLEKDKQVADQLQQNLNSLHINNARLIQTNSISYLNKTADCQYQIIFIDPPFYQDLVQPCCEALEKNGYLTEDALIYIEMESDITDCQLPNNWQLLKSKNTSQVCYQLYQRS